MNRKDARTIKSLAAILPGVLIGIYIGSNGLPAESQSVGLGATILWVAAVNIGWLLGLIR